MVVRCDIDMANICWTLFYEFYYPSFIQNPFLEPDAPTLNQVGVSVENQQQLPIQETHLSYQYINPAGYAATNWNHSMPNQIQSYPWQNLANQGFSNTPILSPGVHIITQEPKESSNARNSWQNHDELTISKSVSRQKSVDRTITDVLQQVNDGRTRERSPTPQSEKYHNRSQGGMTTTTRESDGNSNFERVPVLGSYDETILVSAAEMELVRATFQKAAQRRKT